MRETARVCVYRNAKRDLRQLADPLASSSKQTRHGAGLGYDSSVRTHLVEMLRPASAEAGELARRGAAALGHVEQL